MTKDNKNTQFDIIHLDKLIRAAWEDRVSFDSIKIQYGLTEDKVIALMKKNMKPKMFIIWRERVQGRKTKHSKKLMLLEQAEVYETK